ncbi:GNAT family N-acetyltransferase [Actinoplanes awajinensis]|uniref:GCN5 family acetyltransferase n=1 Tax=Actinoplanes awajinensis subsp. mycoplanecinus TaxID=135947 RepID=A0A0X3V2J8_9ACTN|nr:GNAT family N-acetyltransferase [Actinoplanes awajinensis]KUL39005.1 GCN5 family acetyltransferase [Actinoplanes awajinensis subsp. mycoplanecinus]
MPDLTVREMTADEFDAWHEAVMRAFATAQAEAGSGTFEENLQRTRDGQAALLPRGQETPGMIFLRGVRGDGAVVGTMWISLEHPRGFRDCAFLYEIAIDEEFQGAGYGRALLTAGEQAVRERGVPALELNVFGDNARAIGLYTTAGYRVVTQQMRKDLRSGSADHEG